jgi:hypothetical protein
MGCTAEVSPLEFILVTVICFKRRKTFQFSITQTRIFGAMCSEVITRLLPDARLQTYLKSEELEL